MTHITVVILFICPQDKSDKEQDAADNRELQHSGHHADTAVSAHEGRKLLMLAACCVTVLTHCILYTHNTITSNC